MELLGRNEISSSGMKRILKLEKSRINTVESQIKKPVKIRQARQCAVAKGTETAIRQEVTEVTHHGDPRDPKGQ